MEREPLSGPTPPPPATRSMSASDSSVAAGFSGTASTAIAAAARQAAALGHKSIEFLSQPGTVPSLTRVALGILAPLCVVCVAKLRDKQHVGGGSHNRSADPAVPGSLGVTPVRAPAAAAALERDRAFRSRVTSGTASSGGRTPRARSPSPALPPTPPLSEGGGAVGDDSSDEGAHSAGDSGGAADDGAPQQQRRASFPHLSAAAAAVPARTLGGPTTSPQPQFATASAAAAAGGPLSTGEAGLKSQLAAALAECAHLRHDETRIKVQLAQAQGALASKSLAYDELVRSHADAKRLADSLEAKLRADLADHQRSLDEWTTYGSTMQGIVTALTRERDELAHDLHQARRQTTADKDRLKASLTKFMQQL